MASKGCVFVSSIKYLAIYLVHGVSGLYNVVILISGNFARRGRGFYVTQADRFIAARPQLEAMETCLWRFLLWIHAAMICLWLSNFTGMGGFLGHQRGIPRSKDSTILNTVHHSFIFFNIYPMSSPQ